MQNGPENEFESKLDRDQAALVMDAPGIRMDSGGTSLAETKGLTSTPAFRKTSIPTFVAIHGFGPKGFALNPEIKIISGRGIRPGAREIMVGIAARDQVASRSATMSFFPMGHGRWSGVFSEGGDALEGDLITDRDMLMSAVKRGDFNIVIAELERPDAMGRFKAALAANRALAVMAEREADYYAHVSADDRALISSVAYMIGAIMGLGRCAEHHGWRSARQAAGNRHFARVGFRGVAGGDFGGERVPAAGAGRGGIGPGDVQRIAGGLV